MLHDWVYFSSYVVALVLFLAFNFYIDGRLAGEPRFIVTAVFLLVVFVSIFALHEWREKQEWEAFVLKYECRVVESAVGYPLNGEYGKTAYQCNNNFIYWR